MKESSQQMPVNISMYEQDLGIDPFELWDSFWRQRLIILAAMLCGVIISSVYLFFAKPAYKAEVFFLPPLQQDIAELKHVEDILDRQNELGNQIAQVEKKMSVSRVYEQFFENLQSRQVARRFYEENKLKSWYASDRKVDKSKEWDLFENYFYKKLKIEREKKGGTVFSSVSFELGNPEKSAEWLNKYVEFIVQETRQQFVQELYARLNSKKINLQTELGYWRKQASNDRSNRIVQIEEALKIAKAAGIKKFDASLVGSNGSRDSYSREVKSAESSRDLYMRGVSALSTELQILKNRKSDDPFVPEINDLEQRASHLEVVKIKEDAIHPVRIDQKANIPSKPFRPKKLLILVMGIVLGGLAGMFIGYIKNELDKRRESSKAC